MARPFTLVTTTSSECRRHHFNKSKVIYVTLAGQGYFNWNVIESRGPLYKRPFSCWGTERHSTAGADSLHYALMMV